MAKKASTKSIPVRKPLSRQWKIYTWCSSLLMMVLIVGFLLYSQYFSVQAQSGVADTEFTSLTILLLLATLAVGIANSITYTFLLLKRRVPTIWKVILIIVFIPALIIALGGLYTAINAVSKSVRYQQNYEQDNLEFQADELKKYKEQIPKAISAEDATELLNQCKVIGFYYTAQNEEPTNAERSVTGILSIYIGDERYRIHIAERQEATLVPIAREAKAKCLGKPQLWYSGIYE